ncbi:uncharacterized protein [Apostichopus japonicus]|uniref:uncharacterized protein n=1 Tax=Stichopus japonicus TaxID=307972 RepID=UPI003AB43781
MKGANFLILITINLAFGENRFTEKAIEFLTDAKQILPMVRGVPDIKFTIEMALVDKLEYRFYDVKIRDIEHKPKSFLAVKGDAGLSWQEGELRVDVQYKWTYGTHRLC